MIGGTRRKARKVLRGPARSVTARRAVAARINNRRGPPGAVTGSQKTTYGGSLEEANSGDGR